jgi:hypothetical protein
MIGINSAAQCLTPKVRGLIHVGRFAVHQYGTESGMVHVCPGKYDLVSQTLTPTPVPLPAALPLLLGGVAGLGFMRRRKSI